MSVIIFDLDGTLLDVREGFYWQFQELTLIYDGVAVSREDIRAAAHGKTEEIVRMLVNNSDVSFEEILATHHDLRLQSYDRFLKLYTGVPKMLEYLSSNGFRVGALTSGNSLTVSCLSRTKIRHHFESIISAEHVDEPKPHPQGLLLLMDRLGARPEDTIMIGDTVVDILAGKNAGADYLTKDIISISEILKNHQIVRSL
jgi:pyrophosphatase PpaX